MTNLILAFVSKRVGESKMFRLKSYKKGIIYALIDLFRLLHQ